MSFRSFISLLQPVLSGPASSETSASSSKIPAKASKPQTSNPLINIFEDADPVGTSNKIVLNSWSQALKEWSSSLFTSTATKEVTKDIVANSAKTVGSSVAETGAGALESSAVTAGIGSGLKAVPYLAMADSAISIITNWGKNTPEGGAMSGLTFGAALGSVVPGIGTLAGGAIGALVGGALGFIHSGKHKDQVQRDQFRGVLQQSGILDENFQIKLADGTSYNIGADGAKKAEFGNLRPYEIDPSKPGAGDIIAMLSPLMEIVSGGNQKIKTDFTGYFTNAALSNAVDNPDKAKQNVAAIYAQFGIPLEQIAKAVAGMVQNGQLPQQAGEVYMAKLDELQKILGEQPKKSEQAMNVK